MVKPSTVLSLLGPSLLEQLKLGPFPNSNTVTVYGKLSRDEYLHQEGNKHCDGKAANVPSLSYWQSQGIRKFPGWARHIFGFGGLQGRNSYNYETQWKIQGIIPYA